MKFAHLFLALILAAGCSDDSDKKAANNLAMNNVENNSTNSGTNNTGSNNANNTTGTNNGLNSAQQCYDPEECNFEQCQQIANAATYCGWPLNLRVDECQTPDEDNECCDDSQCTDGTNGRCISPFVGYCGGAGPETGNQCRYDECQIGTDCPENQVCAQAGTFGRPVNTCIIALCERDADCENGAEGTCALVHTSDTCPEPMLGCTYKGDECRAAYQCDNGQVCVNGACLNELQVP